MNKLNYMTLNEHLISTVLVPEEAYDKLKLTENLCDLFAINFTDFCNENYIYQKHNTWFAFNEVGEWTTEELLIIYKNKL